MKQLYCILIEAGSGGILLRRSGGGWELPRFGVPDPGSADTWDTSGMRGIITENLGVDAYPIYAMEVDTPDAPGLLAAFDLVREAGMDREWQWVSARDAGSCLGDTFEQSLMEGHLLSRKRCVDSGIVPWLEIGWLREAKCWIGDQLGARGIVPRSRPEPVTSRFIGRTLQIETDIGRVYFKAVGRAFCREVAITLELCAWRPEHIPAPLAADPTPGWMLTGEAQGPTLLGVSDVGAWERAVRVYAQMQKEAAPLVAQGSLGALYDWRPETVAAGIDRLLGELDWLQAGFHDPLSEQDAEALRRGAPQIKEMCIQVADSGIPATLEHGDLHPGNVRMVGSTPVYLDWAWSCVTHPFMSLSLFIAENLLPPAIRPAREQLLAAYLDEWREYGPQSDLEALARLVHAWSVVEYAAADAEWMRSYLERLPRGPFPRNSYLGWALRMRQYYLVKCLRRMANLIRH